MNTTKPLQVISLGAGVQSSTMALMAARGILGPMPDFAVFADTQAEPESVYTWLNWLEKQLPFPLVRVTTGNLTAAATRVRVSKKSGNGYLKPALPVFFTQGGGYPDGKGQRHCTLDYKIIPIQREIKKRRAGCHVQQWIGISLDELIRMKTSRETWCTNVYPLVDQRMTRHDCLRWMKANGFPQPPRSACVYCPYHNDREWHRLKTKEPVEFAKAVAFETRLQSAASKCLTLSGVPFLHRSGQPIGEVEFDPEGAAGQRELFGNECEGMCGV